MRLRSRRVLLRLDSGDASNVAAISHFYEELKVLTAATIRPSQPLSHGPTGRRRDADHAIGAASSACLCGPLAVSLRV